MKQNVLVVTLLTIFVSGDGLAQGHPDAKGEASVQIHRESEYKAESKAFEKRVPVTLEYNAGGCNAELHLEYFQKGTDAHVKTTLKNEECGASSGNYTLRVRYTDAKGEMDLVEFEETWNRDDDAMVISEKEYFVGDDIDIVRVNTRRLSCSCKGAEAKEEEPDSSEL